MTDRVWNSLPDTPRRAFGSALAPATDGRIVSPPLITEPTRQITRRELRRAIDGVPPIPVEHLRAIMKDGNHGR